MLPAFFSLGYFSYRVLQFCQGLTLNLNSPASTFHIAESTAMPPSLACSLREDLDNFLSQLASNCDPPISASQVAEIIGMSHYAHYLAWDTSKVMSH
jgi:hypothetical protein